MCEGDGTRLAGDASQTYETGKMSVKFIVYLRFDRNPGKVTFCFLSNLRFSADLTDILKK